MMLKEFDLDDYLFDISAKDLDPDKRASIEDRLRQEIREIFYSRNEPEPDG